MRIQSSCCGISRISSHQLPLLLRNMPLAATNDHRTLASDWIHRRPSIEMAPACCQLRRNRWQRDKHHQQRMCAIGSLSTMTRRRNSDIASAFTPTWLSESEYFCVPSPRFNNDLTLTSDLLENLSDEFDVAVGDCELPRSGMGIS